MATRAKLTLEPLEDDNGDENSTPPEPTQHSSKKAEPERAVDKEQNLPKTLFYIGLTIASLIIFKRKLF